MKIMKYSFKLIFISFLFLLGIYLYAWISPKLKVNTANSQYFYDNNNNLLSSQREWITYDNINKNIINATLSIEDKRYFKHKGFDFIRIFKSIYVNLRNQKALEGASTITQQYAKNLYLNFDKTLKRKLNEAWLTIRLETHYNKKEILEGYLNTINYGNVFGIENASKFYFNKSTKDLSLAEASLLAGIPNSPNNYSPFKNYDESKKRQKIVLNLMVKNDFISQKEADEAFNQKLTFNTKTKNELNSVMYYQDAVLKELNNIKSISNNSNKTANLKIYTTFDINAQKSIEDAIKDIDSSLQIASVVLDPKDGSVLGLVGGNNYNTSQFNRALTANRSVGSTIKPFLYYSALENNFTPSTKFLSEKTTFTFSENKEYTPHNYANKYPNKQISLGTAIAYSDNIYAVKTHLFLGTNTLVDTMKRVGITTKLDDIPSLALGSQAISLLELTNAYGILANEGNKIKPHFIRKIEDMNGNILYEYKNIEEPILNKSSVFILNEMLANTSNPNFIDYSYPTSYSIKHKLTKKYAIKTGTTEFDHLIFGFNKDVVVGLWTGYDDNKPITNNESSNNKLIWANIIENYLKDKKDNWYKMPNNVIGVLVDPISGELTKNNKKAVIQYYLRGTEPSNNYQLDDIIPTMKYD